MSSLKINHLGTEARNDKTKDLDTLEIIDILKIMNEEDLNVIHTIKDALPDIEQCVQLVISALRQEGRLIYLGAGTSGRLGILDAVECIPTFSTNNVIGIIAGGNSAFVKAVEGAEDSKELAVSQLKEIGLNDHDVVVAIAASGRTPYAIGGLEYARSKNAKCVSIACNKDAELSKYADVAIEVNAGPEILSGSTRLKAGTAQKMILNMISTASMVGIGKVYGNLMVDMKATNLKLEERAKQIVIQATNCDYEKAEMTLKASNQSIKVAIVMILSNVDEEVARHLIEENQGFIRKCL